MSEGAKDRAGTWLDWPVAVMAFGLVLVFTDAKVLGALLFWGGVLALLIRRGVFTPRRR